MTAPARRQRLDAELVRRGMARSRAQAAELVGAGAVAVAGTTATKPATQVTLAEAIEVRATTTLAPGSPGSTTDSSGRAWASRGAQKMLGALADLHVDPVGLRCLDAGASTGGFTHVLLDAGAASVVAVDVGYGQIAWHLRTDARVEVLERTNVRDLHPADVGAPPALVVADLSFIPLHLVLPALAAVAVPDARMLLMVKPQFEVGRSALPRGGVVREPGARAGAVAGVLDAAAGLGLVCEGVAASRLPGPSGNVEYFVHLRAGGGARVQEPEHLRALAAAAVAAGPGGRGETGGHAAATAGARRAEEVG